MAEDEQPVAQVDMDEAEGEKENVEVGITAQN